MFANIQTVVVESNMTGRLHMRSAFPNFVRMIRKGFDRNAVASGFFVFQDNRQGALADGLHGLNPRNTAHRHTPVQKATSVSLATGKAHSNSGGKLGCVYKRTNSSRALGAIFVIDVWSEPGEGGLIHPRYTYV